ncbi:MAG: endonuclease/exonuclease/phosphatase family protein [Gammaproteobacteria bacterium]|nr:endonuclease/exonuclease/phosphatase family protein [Gammaproteobacteria bacterium]MDH5800130.1 endonuclease/exonuclease/phosphatase family protein [Gammaproteobacteria bacterium]
MAAVIVESLKKTVLLLTFFSATAVMAEPLINEFVFNHTGSDTSEYVEISGGVNTDYSTYTIIAIEGDSPNSGSIDAVFSVGNTDASGIWYTGFLNNALENGSVTLLLVDQFSGLLGQDLDTDDNGTLDITPWSRIADAVAVHDGGTADHTYTSVVLTAGFDGGTNTVGAASRIPNAGDTDSSGDWVRNDFHGEGLPGFNGTPEQGEALNTPGIVNALPLIEPPAINLAIYQIQGAAHVSPYVGEKVSTQGVVTASRSSSFYLQDLQGDSDPATSDAILVFAGSGHGVVVGDKVEVTGTVVEFYPGGFSAGNLATTEIIQPQIKILSKANVLPLPVIIGSGGRIPPDSSIDSDSNGDANSGDFTPESDGLDFYESLEAMLVQIDDAIVVDSNRFGEITVVGDNGANASGLNSRGGISISAEDYNPERIIIDDAIIFNEPRVSVGDAFTAPVLGVVDYSFGNFKVLNMEPLPAVLRGNLSREVTPLQSSATRLTVAGFNVENLNAGSPINKINGLAGQIVNNLKSPDIIGLQEIQDSSGSRNDAVTAAQDTANTLIDAIIAAGGPVYTYRDIAPEDNQDGGQPGANIRVGFLYQADRVVLTERPGGDAVTATSLSKGADGVQLSFSPGRIDPTNPAFADSRKPLAAEFMFNNRKVFLIVNHFNSKGGDDPLFGRVQPPMRPSENIRGRQALIVAGFVENILALDDDANIVVLGDLNDFAFSSAVQTLTSVDDMENLLQRLPQNEQYSFIFEGNSQLLDHILVSEELAEHNMAEVDIVHVNSEYHYRNRWSDHDPVVARFCMDRDEPKLTTELQVVAKDANRITLKVNVSVQDEDPEVMLNLLGVYGTHSGKDSEVEVLDDFTFRLSNRHAEKGHYSVKYKAKDTCGNKETTKVKLTSKSEH